MLNQMAACTKLKVDDMLNHQIYTMMYCKNVLSVTFGELTVWSSQRGDNLLDLHPQFRNLDPYVVSN